MNFIADDDLSKILNEIRNGLKNIAGIACWDASNIVTGTLELDFGKVILRKSIISHTISPTGQYNIVIYSSWRLDNNDDAICSSNSPDEIIARSVYQLIGDVVISIDIFPPVWDVVISFSSGKTLRIFCDQIDDPDKNSNWDFRIMDKIYFMGTGKKSISTAKKSGILSCKSFESSSLPSINIDERVEIVKKRLSYEEMDKIAKKIKEI